MNETVKSALLSCTQNVYNYTARGNKSVPYVVYGNDGENVFRSGDHRSERADQGTVDLYTKTTSDPLIRAIPRALDTAGVAVYLNSVQYEDEAGLLHYDWVYEAVA